MRMVPPIVFDSTKSPAERRVFEKLERTELDKQACALHSVNLPRHVYKKMGEIDFVVLSRSGLLVCEVKGAGSPAKTACGASRIVSVRRTSSARVPSSRPSPRCGRWRPI